MLVSNFMIVLSLFVIVVCLALLVVFFLIDLFTTDHASQTNTSYSYNFAEHQNYWEADK